MLLVVAVIFAIVATIAVVTVAAVAAFVIVIVVSYIVSFLKAQDAENAERSVGVFLLLKLKPSRICVEDKATSPFFPTWTKFQEPIPSLYHKIKNFSL